MEGELRGMSRFARKVDNNQSEIIDALTYAGCNVTDMSAAGNGFTDLFVTRAGIHYILEIKGRYGTLTPAQEVFHVKHQPVHVVTNIYEALAAVGILHKVPGTEM
jgi:Holliday junction resolvase